MQPAGSSNEFNRRFVSDEIEQAAGEPDRARLLDQAVQKTLQNLGADLPVSAEDQLRLKSVVSQHRNSALTTAIVAEMIRATFPTSLSGPADASWQQLFEQAATTLKEDPVAGPRLEKIWTQLQQLDFSLTR